MAATLTGVVFVLGKSLLFPSADNPTPVSFAFPTTVPLAQWQPVESSPIEVKEDSKLVSGRLYRYQQDRLPLSIEMRYVTRTNGEVKKLIAQYLNADTAAAKLITRQQEGIGFYSIAATPDRAYLSSCINPRGGSTVTADQFRANRNTYDINLSRIVPWLLGQQELRDHRCLWTVLSIPLENTSAEDAYPILETAWVSWYRWWQPRFPQP